MVKPRRMAGSLAEGALRGIGVSDPGRAASLQKRPNLLELVALIAAPQQKQLGGLSEVAGGRALRARQAVDNAVRCPPLQGA